MSIANINHHLLQRLTMKYLAKNCSAHQFKYLLLTLCLLYNICLQGAGIQKGSNRDYSLYCASRLRQSLKNWQLTDRDWNLNLKEHYLWRLRNVLLWWIVDSTLQNLLTIGLNHMQTESEAKRRNVSVMTFNPWRLPTFDTMIKFKVNMITSQDLLQFFTNNLILVFWSWPSSSSNVDSHTIMDMIHKELIKSMDGFALIWSWSSQIHPLTWSRENG